MEKAKIVVVFPIYNGAKTMLESLQCIADQDFEDFRAIILENGSTDNTVEIAEAFCAGDERFEIIRNDAHLSGIENYMKGFQIGNDRGEYFCLRACDDMSTPDFLSRLVEALDHNPDKVLATTSTLRVGQGEPILVHPDPEILSFWENVSNGRVPRMLSFPAQWCYGVYRSDSAALEILQRRWPELKSAWGAASYTMAEFVIRDLVVWVDGPQYFFTRGSKSVDIYGAKTVSRMLVDRIRFAWGCLRVLDRLPPLPLKTRWRLFKTFWRDGRRKMRYPIRRILRTRIAHAACQLNPIRRS